MSNSQQNNFDKQFDKIKYAVRTHTLNEKSSRENLYSALLKTYSLGLELLHAGELKNFVERRDLKLWNKTAKKNPFHPLSQLAFDGLKKASISQYASLLDYCHSHGFLVADLKNDLRTIGVAELYELSRQTKADSSIEKLYELDQKPHFKWATEQLEMKTAVHKFSTPTNSNFVESDEFQLAMIKVKNGHVEIIGKAEVDKSELKKTILNTAGKPPIYRHEKLVEKDLYQLFKVVDLYTRFSTKVSDVLNDEDNQKLDDGEISAAYFSQSGLILKYFDTQWIAYTASNLPTFKCVQTAISDPNSQLNLLDVKKTYFLSSAHCSVFANQFPYEGNWGLIESKHGVSVTHRGKLQICEFVEIITSETDLRIFDRNHIENVQFDLSKGTLVFLTNWERIHKKSASANGKFPSIFKIGIEASDLHLSFPNNPNNPNEKRAISVGITNTNDEVITDRFLRKDDLSDICNVAVDYNWSFTAAIITVNELHGGLKLKAEDQNNQIEIVIPLCVSVTGELGQITT